MPNLRATRALTVDTGALYEHTRQKFVATVRGLSDEQLQIRVPATPAWSVRDVLAHVVGIATDLNAQRFPAPDDVGGTVWTESQVERGRALPFGEVVAQWDREAAGFEAGLGALGYEVGSHFVADLYVHYCDVRGAVGLPIDADELGVAVALDHYLRWVEDLLTTDGWGTLEVVAGGETWQLRGEGRHRARVRAEPLELLRAVTGRRSERQMRALDWQGDAEAVLELIKTGLTGGYSLRDADLIE